MEIEDRVLLLAIYKRKEGESLKDILLILEDSNLFTIKEGKRRLKTLKESGYIENNRLTVVGISRAKEIEEEFKI